MEDNLDSFIMKDWERSIGLSAETDGIRDPESVSMEGIETPTDESIGAYAEGVGETWAEMLRGVAAGTIGGLGEAEQLVRGVKAVMQRKEGEDLGDAFKRGLGESTFLLTGDEVSAALPQLDTEMSPEDKRAADQIGQMLGLGAPLRAITKAPKATAAVAGMLPTTAEGATDQEFYDAIAYKMETGHGWDQNLNGFVAVPTADARERNTPANQRSVDIGYGHKVKRNSAEWKSGKIYGIPFKDKQGNFVPITEAQAMTILVKDYEKNLNSARSTAKGWDAQLKAQGTSWDKLDKPYQQVLTSLAYNLGGAGARGYRKALKAAVAKDIGAFAKEIRRQDAGNWTKGMDNRAAKELYYAGLIKGLSEVQNELPLADANVAGIPQ
jgi:GH24 family phage-related lysozyme (muramidase)